MTKLIVGNWKSHKNSQEIESWVQALGEEVKASNLSPNSFSDLQIVIAPSFPLLQKLGQMLTQSNVGLTMTLGVQDLSPFPSGAYTGAVSGSILSEMGVDYAIVGHSERRRYFHETDQDVANKVDQALASQITPIVCVDEDYIESQASAIENDLLERCVVAYEPLAAIGTGNNADVGRVKEVNKKIKNIFGAVPVIYGGSVNSQNVGEYLLVSDGVLPGGASLDAKEFGQMILAGVVNKA